MAIQLEAQPVEGYYRRGMCKLSIGAIHDAIGDLNMASKTEDELSQDPNYQVNYDIPDGLGQCNHALKDYQEAMKYYDTAISRFQNAIKIEMSNEKNKPKYTNVR